MPCSVSLTSSRISITPLRKKKTISDNFNQLVKLESKSKFQICYESNFQKEANPFVMSKASKRKLFDSVNYMYALSPKREIQMQTGKSIYNFRMSFVTLTLPSRQSHSDTYIKSKFLNQFLIEIKRHYHCNNFVWKAELQKNDNIHFHLILDKYVDFQALRRRWNRIIEKGDYVSTYSERMSKLSSQDYFKLRLDNCISHNKKYGTDYKITFKESYKAYQKGKKTKWKNPNSVDVKSVYGKKDLAVYLSKYISKKDDDKDYSDDEISRQKSFGRSWSRSYSLVRMCRTKSIDYDDVSDLINYFRHKKSNVKKIKGQFFEVFYFNLDELHKSVKDYLLSWLQKIAVNHDYIIPF